MDNAKMYFSLPMRKFFLCGTLLTFFFSPMLNAQSAHSLGDVLTLTLWKNPELNAYSYDMRAADARILQSGLRPNPGLDVETENIGAPIFVQNTLLLSQLIELGGKRKARIKFAQTDRDKVALDYEVMKRQVFVDTALLFIDVLINQQKIAFLEDNLKVLQDFSAIVEKRVKAGKASIIEKSNYIVLLNTARMDLQSAQNQLRNAKIKLAAQWGDASDETFVIAGTLDWIPELIPLEKMGDFLQEHPQIVRSYFEDDLRRARIALERSRAYPDVNLRGGPRYLEEAHKPVWVVGVSFPLPISDRNQGHIWESAENLEKLEQEREVLMIKLLTALKTSYSTIQSISSELNILTNFVIPAAQKAYEFSYKGYELARYNYLELLETERAYRTSKMRHLQALGEYHKALIILEGLTGSRTIINPELNNLQPCE